LAAGQREAICRRHFCLAGEYQLSPRGKRLSQQLHSEATTSFSDARQCLPLELFHKPLRHTAAQLFATFQIPERFGLKVDLMDGTTCWCA